MNLLKAVGVGLLGLVVGGAAVYAWTSSHRSITTFDTPYQAVLLDTGQVYYGKITKLGTDLPELRDVFYIQSQTNPETKAVTNILVRRGKEFHSPDHMVINSRHIVVVEPVGEKSKVAELIAEQSK
jgi:hypothetical protein